MSWERSLTTFLEPWRKRVEVTGALICGSRVTGDATPRSDLDVQIVLAEGTPWRERGNRLIDGVLFEYFANAPAQTRAYFENDRRSHRPVTATMFATGRVIFDEVGDLAALRREAGGWLRRPFFDPKAAEVERMKYAAWNSLDNLRDLYERQTPIAHAYHEHLQVVYRGYARFLRQSVLPPAQLGRYLTDVRFRAKYRLRPFPDERFRDALVQALEAPGPAEMLHYAEHLTHHMLDRMGGFEIDGWRLRDLERD